MTQIKKPSSEASSVIAPRRGRLIVLEGMPGAGKTTLIEALRANDARVLGEYTAGDGATVPIDGHPAVENDDAHQGNWIRKTDQAAAALRDGASVYVDRDWLSSLAYAYSIADTDGGRLLDQRAHWALEHVDHGTLLLPDVYVILQLSPSESLHRRHGRLRPQHPWSRPDELRRLQHFYASPRDVLIRVHPTLAVALSKAIWKHVSGLTRPAHTLRMLRALAGRP